MHAIFWHYDFYALSFSSEKLHFLGEDMKDFSLFGINAWSQYGSVNWHLEASGGKEVVPWLWDIGGNCEMVGIMGSFACQPKWQCHRSWQFHCWTLLRMLIRLPLSNPINALQDSSIKTWVLSENQVEIITSIVKCFKGERKKDVTILHFSTWYMFAIFRQTNCFKNEKRKTETGMTS